MTLKSNGMINHFINNVNMDQSANIDIMNFVSSMKKEVSQDIIDSFAFTLKSFLDGYIHKDQVTMTV